MIEFQNSAVEPIGCNEEGWQLIKNNYWLFFGMTFVLVLIIILVSLALNFVVGAIVGGLSIALGNVSSSGGSATQNPIAFVPQIISQLVSFVTSIIVTALSGMFACGLYTALGRQARGETPTFENLFDGFQYFQPCLIVSLIVSIVQFLASVALIVTGIVFGVSAFGAGILTTDGKLNPNIFGAFFGVIAIFALIYIIFNAIISVCTFFVFPLIAEHKLSAVEALTLSARAGFGNILGIIGLFIIQLLMSLMGILLCGIGILFVLPIMSAGVYSAYRKVFGESNFNNYRVAPPAPPIFNNKYNY